MATAATGGPGPGCPDGPSAVITTLGLFRFHPVTREMVASVHPGVTVDQVRAETAWPASR
jgi:acyl CoA:acetate/3-ketoacid CoA transferase beta subunit